MVAIWEASSMLTTMYPHLPSSMSEKQAASGLSSSIIDWMVEPRLAAVANSFAFSMGMRQVIMKRISPASHLSYQAGCSLPSLSMSAASENTTYTFRIFLHLVGTSAESRG
jgi:hypothetical protein